MRRARGFTAIELMLVVVIMAILAALSYSTLVRMKPRANLANTVAELDGLLHNARQNALATGYNTVVMFFPSQSNKLSGTGRIVVYQDLTYDFFSASAAVHFGSWDASLYTGSSSESLLGSIELPKGISMGFGPGITAPTLPAPYSVAVSTSSPCNFCSTTSPARGAVVFNSRGKATFYSGDGSPLSMTLGTVAFTGAPDLTGYSLLLITSSGAVRSFSG